MNRDERRGRDANLGGKPFNLSENIDWQRGWQNAEDDRGLDLDNDDGPLIAQAVNAAGGMEEI